MVFSRTNFQAKNLAEAMKLPDFLHDLRQRITKFEMRQAFLRKPYLLRKRNHEAHFYTNKNTETIRYSSLQEKLKLSTC